MAMGYISSIGSFDGKLISCFWMLNLPAGIWVDPRDPLSYILFISTGQGQLDKGSCWVPRDLSFPWGFLSSLFERHCLTLIAAPQFFASPTSPNRSKSGDKIGKEESFLSPLGV